MDDGTDGWMEKDSQLPRPLLYVIANKLGLDGKKSVENPQCVHTWANGTGYNRSSENKTWSPQK
jgi:hypothetical protein